MSNVWLISTHLSYAHTLFSPCILTLDTHTHTPGALVQISLCLLKLLASAFLAIFLYATGHSVPKCWQSGLQLSCHFDLFQPAKEQKTEGADRWFVILIWQGLPDARKSLVQQSCKSLDGDQMYFGARENLAGPLLTTPTYITVF